MPSSRRPENGVAVTVRDGDGSVTIPWDECREWHVVNGGEAGLVVRGLDAWSAVRWEFFDARGRVVAEGSRAFGRLEQLDVPAGGRLTAREVTA